MTNHNDNKKIQTANELLFMFFGWILLNPMFLFINLYNRRNWHSAYFYLRNKYFSFKFQILLIISINLLFPKVLCPSFSFQNAVWPLVINLYWQLLYFSQHLTFQLSLTTLIKFRISPIVVRPLFLKLMKCDILLSPLHPQFHQKQEGSLYWVEEGIPREKITLLSGIAATLGTCLPSQLKHCLTDFTLQSEAELFSSIKVSQSCISTYCKCNN